jgi:subtilase family serine protease
MAMITGFIALLGALTGVVPAAAAAPGPLVALTASAAPSPQPGAVRLGALPSQTVLHLSVTLNIRDQAGLTALLNGLAVKSSPYFHDFLTPAQVGAAFGPTLGQVAAVSNALRAQGLTPGPVTANRLAIPVTATAAEAERAFGISMVAYRMPDGRLAYANASAPRLAASVAPLVSGVLGLDDLVALQSSAQRVAAPAGHAARSAAAPAVAGPLPCGAAVAAAASNGSYTTNQIAQHYVVTGLYALGDLGQGKHIALAELEPFLTSDVSAYESCYGIHTKVNRVAVVPGLPAGPGMGEAALDVELTASLAPDAVIDVYEAPNTISDLFAIINQFAGTSTDNVLEVSWGTCEAALTDLQVNDYEDAISEADSEGKTVVAAAGDAGSTDCYPADAAKAATLSVESPADSPFAVAVGGTTISSDEPLSSEVTWNDSAKGVPADSGGAGGGGVSDYWCMPAYQYRPAIPGLINADSLVDSAACKGTTSGTNALGLLRQMPDISADADWYTGYVAYHNGAWLGGWGGTSTSAVVMGAIAALIDASPFCADYRAGNAGLYPQDLYGLVSTDPSYVYPSSPRQQQEVISDVTSGNNDYTASGYTAGLYPATKGYDMATGLGIPLVGGLPADFGGYLASASYMPGLAAKMCWAMGTKVGTNPQLSQVTSVTPDVGRAGRAITVTVHGRDFLPIPGANLAKIIVNPKTFQAVLRPANCSSATVCTVTLPAESARVVDVQIATEDFRFSPMGKGDRFTYAAAPHIARMSSYSGGPGTKVTIYGSNFIGVSGVYFGSRKGTGLRVVSPAELVVVVPAGSGTVQVKVVAVGGTSNSRTFSY